MKRSEAARLRVGIIGAGTLCEHLLLPALRGPDIAAPEDDGAWWLRRPASNVDIAFESPFRVDVAALCDADPSRLKRVGEASGVPALYLDWKRLLAEHASPLAASSPAGELDALFLALPPAQTDEVLCALATRRLHTAAPWLWLAGPPALSSQRARELAALNEHRVAWCARFSSRALAHRAARRLIARGEIGLVRAISLRWHTPLPRHGSTSTHEVASICSALDLLLEFAVPGLRDEVPALESVLSRIASHEHAGASVALLEFTSGVGATLTMSAADEWSAPLPRLEAIGTQGRFLVCEGGREVRLHAPREGARAWSAPSGAPGLSSAEASGVAEDARAFLHALARSRRTSKAGGASDEVDALRQRRAHSLGRAALVLRLWEDLAAASSFIAAFDALDDAPSPTRASAGERAVDPTIRTTEKREEPEASGRARPSLRRVPRADEADSGSPTLPFDFD
jgi:predicted dehydrogenase